MDSTTSSRQVRWLTLACGAMMIGGLASIVGAGQKGADMKIAARPAVPDVIAVRIRHDMCPFCKKFDPQFSEVVDNVSDEPVLFVTLDLSTEATQQQSALLVGALGLEHIWTGDMSKIGTITFVHGSSKKTIASTHQVDLETVQAALGQALASVAQ